VYLEDVSFQDNVAGLIENEWRLAFRRSRFRKET
jgi:hypothetical protein